MNVRNFKLSTASIHNKNLTIEFLKATIAQMVIKNEFR